MPAHPATTAPFTGSAGAKSRAWRRSIPLGPHLLALLRQWKIAQPKEQRINGLVFPDSAGDVEDHTAIYRRF